MIAIIRKKNISFQNITHIQLVCSVKKSYTMSKENIAQNIKFAH